MIPIPNITPDEFPDEFNTKRYNDDLTVVKFEKKNDQRIVQSY